MRTKLPPGTRVLTLGNAYDPGWQAVSAAGRILPWRHVAVDGALNGWLVPPGAGGRTVVLRFGPFSWYQRLQWVALAAGLAACLLWMVMRRRQPAPRRYRHHGLFKRGASVRRARR